MILTTGGRPALLCLAAVLSLILAARQQSFATECEQSGGNALWKGLVSNGGRFHLEYRLVPETLERSRLFGMYVRISSGQRIKSLAIGASMPAHGHGMTTEPIIRRCSPELFWADGLFLHMPGKWSLYIDIASDRVVERAEDELVLR